MFHFEDPPTAQWTECIRQPNLLLKQLFNRGLNKVEMLLEERIRCIIIVTVIWNGQYKGYMLSWMIWTEIKTVIVYSSNSCMGRSFIRLD